MAGAGRLEARFGVNWPHFGREWPGLSGFAEGKSG
jgi:hypothetical protein